MGNASIHTRARLVMRLMIMITCMLIIVVGSAFSQTEDGNEDKDAKKKYFYEWTDANGVIHITDSFGKVPEPYRSKAREIESLTGKQAAGQEQQPPAEPLPEAGTGAAEAAAKAEWQQRIGDWKKRLATAENRYQELDGERNELLRAWGSAALAPIENRLKAGQIEQQMREVKAEIETARNMIDSVIPEEARKAGVPPGWLRE